MAFHTRWLKAVPAIMVQLSMSCRCFRLERTKLTTMHPNTSTTTRIRLLKKKRDHLIKCDTGTILLK